jgi:O-antigen/teichoic acid export membrane protein
MGQTQPELDTERDCAPAAPGGMGASLRAGVSGHGLASSIGKDTIFGIVASLAQIGTRLFTVPIVLKHLGLDGYGIWSIIMTIASYMRFGSAGIKSAFQKYAAEATGNGDFKRASELISTGNAAMLAISVLALIPTALFSRRLAGFAGVPDRFLESTAISISLLAVIMIFANVGAAFQAIVMGSHRVDIARKISTTFTCVEAVVIVALLHFGFGLVAMSAVMALSEVSNLACCYWFSLRVAPELRVSLRHFNPRLLKELVAFAGSYQLVSVMEILSGAILPVAILRTFGASAAGICAIAGRLVQAALLPQGAMLQPLLSGASMVFATGSVENMRRLLTKSFKTTLALSLLPLAFVCAFGTTIVLAWTGEAGGQFRQVLWLLSAAALFRSLSSLGRILYRISGQCLIDNIQFAISLGVLTFCGTHAYRLGFLGVLAGLSVTEFIGLILMLGAVQRTFEGFKLRVLLPDLLRMAFATLAMLGVALAAAAATTPWKGSERFVAMAKLGEIGLVTALALVPILLLTGSVSMAEIRAIGGVFRKKTGLGPELIGLRKVQES